MARSTANERFKQSSRSSFWIGLIIGTVIHVGVFAGSPAFALDPHGATGEDRATVVITPEIPPPEPPAPVRPPVAPVIGADAPADLTLDPVTPEQWRQRPLDPPPPSGGEEEAIPSTPMTLAPRLLNATAVQRALQRHYPPILRDAGVGGTVSVWFHIDGDGRVVETRVDRSSGYDALDRAALVVAAEMAFSPAYNREKKVPVWVSLDITFEVR